MKNQRLNVNRAIGAVLSVVCSAVMAFSASAETVNGVTLNISTDKSSYAANENVSISISAKNDNSYSIKDVSINTIIPDGFTVNGNHSTNLTYSTIESGESIQDGFSIYKYTYIDNNPNPNPTPTPTPDDDFIYPPFIPNNDNDDGEDVSAGAGAIVDSEEIAVTKINTGKFAIVFLLSICTIFGIALLIKNRKNIKKFISMFLAIGIIIPFCADLGTIDVSAESGNIRTSTTFVYNGQKYTISADMSYNYDNSNDDSDPNEREPEINIPPYTIDPTHISEDIETGTKYIDNEIIVYFVNGYTEEMVSSIGDYLNGTIVNGAAIVDKYVFRIQGKTDLIRLNSLCEEIMNQFSFVELATVDTVYYADDIMDTVNDPWYYEIDRSNLLSWDEVYPYGSNKNLEMIDAISAWEYNSRLSNVRIGVVDSGFFRSADLVFANNSSMSFTADSNNYHGTHVSGIIGAGFNNNRGITGILEKCELYGYDCSNGLDSKGNLIINSDKIYEGLEKAVKQNCKVINFSLGHVNKTEDNPITEDEVLNSPIRMMQISSSSDKAFIEMKKLIVEDNYDFLVVQSAGNDGYNDSSLNAMFSGIEKRSNLYSFYWAYNQQKAEEITSRIVVVGSVGDNSNDYEISTFSNRGSIVDIYAPGFEIRSLGYESTNENVFCHKMSGTSMAAPHVTAVCGMIWAANSSLSAKDVKNIVLRNYDHIASDGISLGHKPVLNAKLCVEDALNITDPIQLYGEIKGTVISSSGEKEITNVHLSYTDSSGITLTKSLSNTFSFDAMPNVHYSVIVDYDYNSGENSDSYKSNDIVISNGETLDLGIIDIDGKNYENYIATLTQYDTPFNINDEIPFTATLRLSDGTIDISDDSGYKVTVDNEDCLTVLDIIEESDKTYTIKTKALKAGTATLTITFDNGASASSTIIIEDATALGGIKGIVQDGKTGAPLSDVAISIIDSNNNTLATIYSDESGNFAQNCENGTYSVVFSKDGYITKTVSDVIVADEINDMTTVSLTANIFAGGDGSVENPYQVATAAQLDAVRNNLGANYIQISDIDLSTYNNWEPIGDTLTPFTGTYNGQDYSIQNLTINVTNENDLLSQGYSVKLWNIGLFGEGYNANITNIKLCDVDINVLYSDDSASFMCGSLIGYGFDCHIDNIETSGRIYMEGEFYNIGGISGCGNVSDSINRIAIIIDCGGYDTWGVGGISGCGNANSCVNYGNIDAKFTGVRADNPVIGGIIGEGEDSSNYCTNYGNLKCISGSSWCTVGGVVGDGGDNTITFCKNYGDVSANTLIFSSVSMNGRFNCSAGGVVGTGYNVDISNCYNEGKITSTACGGSVAAGGIAGWIYYLHGEGICQISNCVNKASIESYSIKTESDGTQTISPSSYIGYIGAGECTYSNNYALDSATINSIIPSEDISETEKNGELLSDAELLAKINELILI